MRRVAYYQSDDGRLFASEDAARAADEAVEIGVPLLASLQHALERACDAAGKENRRAQPQMFLLWLREDRAALLEILDAKS